MEGNLLQIPETPTPYVHYSQVTDCCTRYSLYHTMVCIT